MSGQAATRRDADRRNNDRGAERDENAYRKRPAAAVEPPRRPQLNEYWIDGEGIDRQVLQTEICKYLGNEATSRPGDYEGRPGFKIKALRPFTPDMLDDLREASKAFIRESSAHQKRFDRDLAYQDSRTFESSNPPMDYSDRPYQQGRVSPAYTGAPSGYVPPALAGFPTTQAPFGSTSTYAVPPGIPASSPMPMDARYPPDYAYPPPPQGRDSRDGRDPRQMPAYGSSYSNQYQPPYGNDPYRNADPRADPRMKQEPPSYYNNNNNNGASHYPANDRDTRMETGYYEAQAMPGPGGYGPGRGVMSPNYGNQGRDYRAPPVDPRNYGPGRQ